MTLKVWVLITILVTQCKNHSLAATNSETRSQAYEITKNSSYTSDDNTGIEIDSSETLVPPVYISNNVSNSLILKTLKAWWNFHFKQLKNSNKQAFKNYYSIVSNIRSNSFKDSTLIWKHYSIFCKKFYNKNQNHKKRTAFIQQVENHSKQLDNLNKSSQFNMNTQIELAKSYSKVAKAYFEQIHADHSELKEKSKWFKDSAQKYLKTIRQKKDINDIEVKQAYSQLAHAHGLLLDAYSKTIQSKSRTPLSKEKFSHEIELDQVKKSKHALVAQTDKKFLNAQFKINKLKNKNETRPFKKNLYKTISNNQQGASRIELRSHSSEKDLTEALEMNEKLREDLEEKKVQIGKLAALIEAGNREITKLTNQVETLFAQTKEDKPGTSLDKNVIVKKLSETVLQLQNKQRAAQKVVDRLTSKLKTFEDHEQALKFFLSASQGVREKFKSQTIPELLQMIQERGEQIQSLQEKLQELKDHAEQESRTADEKENGYLAQVKQLNSKLQEEALNYQQIISELQGRIQTQGTDLKETLGESGDSKEDLEEKNAQIGELAALLEARNREIVELTNEVKTLLAQTKEHKPGTSLDKNEIAAKLSDAVLQLQNKQRAAQKVVDRLTSRLKTFKDHERALKFFLSASRGVREKLKSEAIPELLQMIQEGRGKIQSLEKELQELKDHAEQKIRTADEKGKEYLDQVKQLNSKLQEEVSNHQQVISELQSRSQLQGSDLKEALEKNGRLKGDLEEKNVQVGELAALLEARNKENEKLEAKIKNLIAETQEFKSNAKREKEVLEAKSAEDELQLRNIKTNFQKSIYRLTSKLKTSEDHERALRFFLSASQGVREKLKTQKIPELLQMVQEREGRIQSLEEKLRDLKGYAEQNSTVTNQKEKGYLDQLDQLKSKLQEEVSNYQQIISELQGRSQSQGADLEEALEKNGRLKGDLEEKNVQIDELGALLEARNKENEKLETQVRNLIAQAQEFKSNTNREKEVLEAKLAEKELQLRNNKTESQKSIYRLKSKLKTSEDHEGALRFFLSASQRAREKLKSQRIPELLQMIQERERRIQILEGTLQDLKVQADEDSRATDHKEKAYLDQMNQLKSELQEEALNYKQIISDLQGRFNTQGEELRRIMRANENLQLKFDNSQRDHEISHQEAARKMKGLETQITLFRKDLKRRGEALEEEENKNKSLNEQLQKAQQTLHQLQENEVKRDELEKQIIAEQVASQIRKIKSELIQSKQHIEQQKSILTNKAKELAELELENENLKNEKSRLGRKVQQLEQDNQSLNVSLHLNASEIANLKKGEEEHIKHAKSLEHQLKNANENYDRLTQKFLKLQSEEEAAIQAKKLVQSQDLETKQELNRVRADLERATKDIDRFHKLIQENQSTIENDHQEIERLTGKYEENKKSFEDFALQVEQLQKLNQEKDDLLNATKEKLDENIRSFEVQLDKQKNQLVLAQSLNLTLKETFQRDQANLNDLLKKKEKIILQLEKRVKNLEEENDLLKRENETLKAKLESADSRGRGYVENEIAIRENTIQEHEIIIQQLEDEKQLLKGNLNTLEHMFGKNNESDFLSYFSLDKKPILQEKKESGYQIHSDHDDLQRELNKQNSQHRRIIDQKKDEIRKHDNPDSKYPINEATALISLNRAQEERKAQIDLAISQSGILNRDAQSLISFVNYLSEIPKTHNRAKNHIHETKSKIRKLAEDNQLQNHLESDPEILSYLEELESLSAREKTGDKFIGEYTNFSCLKDPFNQKKIDIFHALSNDIDEIYQKTAIRLDQLRIESEIGKFLKNILEDHFYDIDGNDHPPINPLVRISPDTPINYSKVIKHILEDSKNANFPGNDVISEKSQVNFSYANQEYTFEFQFMNNPDHPYGKYLIPLRLNQVELKLVSKATFKEVHHALNMSNFHREVYFHVKSEGSLGVNYLDKRGGNLDKNVAFDKTEDEILAEQEATMIANYTLHREIRNHKNPKYYLEPYYGIDLYQVFKKRSNQEYRAQFDNENQWLKLRDECAKAIVTQIDNLHKHNFIHRDIKPQNILFKVRQEDEKSSICNLIDFGSSIFYTKGKIVSAGYNFTPGFVGWKYDLNAQELDHNYQRFREIEKKINKDNRALFSNQVNISAPSIPTENANEFSDWMLAKLDKDNKEAYQYLGIHNDYFQLAIVLMNLYYGNDDELKDEVNNIMALLKNLDLLPIFDRTKTNSQDGGPGAIILKFLNREKVKNDNNPAVKLMKNLVYVFFPVFNIRGDTLQPSGRFMLM